MLRKNEFFLPKIAGTLDTDNSSYPGEPVLGLRETFNHRQSQSMPVKCDKIAHWSPNGLIKKYLTPTNEHF